jgi:hypothetical protein
MAATTIAAEKRPATRVAAASASSDQASCLAEKPIERLFKTNTF